MTVSASRRLIAAIHAGDGAGVAQCLHEGEPVAAVNRKGWSLLVVAMHQKQESVARQLLAAGANPNAQTGEEASPLALALWNGWSEFAQELVHRGANVAEERQHSAIAIAERRHRWEMCRFLYERGAPLGAQSQWIAEAARAFESNDDQGLLAALRYKSRRVAVFAVEIEKRIVECDEAQLEEYARLGEEYRSRVMLRRMQAQVKLLPCSTAPRRPPAAPT